MYPAVHPARMAVSEAAPNASQEVLMMAFILSPTGCHKPKCAAEVTPARAVEARCLLALHHAAPSWSAAPKLRPPAAKAKPPAAKGKTTPRLSPADELEARLREPEEGPFLNGLERRVIYPTLIEKMTDAGERIVEVLTKYDSPDLFLGYELLEFEVVEVRERAAFGLG
jgi:hypothetical protein